MTASSYPVRRKISEPMRALEGGFYAFSAPWPQQIGCFVLLKSATDAPDDLSMWDFVKKQDGWIVFSPVDLSTIPGFAETARAHLPPVGDDGELLPTMLVWLLEPADASTYAAAPNINFMSQSGGRRIGGRSQSSFRAGRIEMTVNSPSFGSLSLMLADGAHGGPAVFSVSGVVNSFTLTLDSEAQRDFTGPVNPNDPATQMISFSIALEGPQAGVLGAPLGLSYGALCQRFGFEPVFRYNPQDIDGPGAPASTATLRMPLFPPERADVPAGDRTAFLLMLNPLHADDPQASGFFPDRFGRLLSGQAASGTVQAAQVARARAMASPCGLFTNGAVMTLVPGDPLAEGQPQDAYPPAGFSYAGPQTGTTPRPMAPVGVFIPTDGTLAEEAPLEIMPGFFSLEFLRLAAGDRLIFTPGQNAFIAPVGTAAADPADAVYTAFPTIFKSSETAAAETGERGYFSQSSTANLYLDMGDGDGVLGAANARLSWLEDPKPFPMLFAGSVTLTDPDGTPVNPGLDARLIEKLEQKAVGPARCTALYDLTQTGPQVQIPVSRRPGRDIATTTWVVTPQGYLVTTGAQGVFSDIILGVGSDGDAEGNALRFAGGGDPVQVDPQVSALLTRDNLFLVATKAEAQWRFHNALRVEGFNFTVDLDASSCRPSILIIKLDPHRSLQEMAEDPTAWADGDRYVDHVPQTVARLKALFAAARAAPDTDNPFGPFLNILDRADWVGIIAFDVPVNGNGMPPDLQMLLGGVDGGLRAHHIGVETNKATLSGASGAGVAQSSIFGVIHYQADDDETGETTSDGPQYRLAELTAQILNTRLVQLHAAVDLTLKTLLGRPVVLTPEGGADPVPAMRINGRYQKHGTTGRVVFSAERPFIYTPLREGTGFVRIVEALHIDQARLEPVSSDKTPDAQGVSAGSETKVRANFTLDGRIFFDPAPFPMAPALDLFSYGRAATQSGTPAQGLSFHDLTVALAFKLDEQGAMVPGSKTVTLEERTLKAVATPEAVRPQSFLGGMPVRLMAFQTATKDKQGATVPVGTGAQSVKVLQLMAVASDLETRAALVKRREAGEDVDPPPMPLSPYTTSAPLYGLSYALSLGSLGSLSGAHAGLNGELVLAWGPSPTVPDNDAAAVYLRLPSLAAGYRGFDLQGFVKTRFGDANLMQVDMGDGASVYALSFDNIQLSVFGYGLPPGLLVDFLLFSGNQAGAQRRVEDASSLGWLLSATTEKHDSEAEDA